MRFANFPVVPAALLAASLALSGCFFGRTVETKYYALDYIPSPKPDRLKKGPYPFSVRLREPTMAEAYRRSQIVYRQSAYQMQFYAYHLWVTDPDRMIGDLLLKHLRTARLFENASRSVEATRPDFQLTTDVQAIEEYDGPTTWYAHLAIEYQLLDDSTGQVVWKQQYDLRKAVAAQEPVFVVRELTALLESIHDQLTLDLEKFLQEAQRRKPAAEVRAR
jgi:cholesterol transport system auxiliary component